MGAGPPKPKPEQEEVALEWVPVWGRLLPSLGWTLWSVGHPRTPLPLRPRERRDAMPAR